MSCTDCIICGGPRFLDKQGIPFCEPCEPVMAEHVASNQIDPVTGEALAICPCGWSSRHPWTAMGRWRRQGAIEAHWRSVRQVEA